MGFPAMPRRSFPARCSWPCGRECCKARSAGRRPRRSALKCGKSLPASACCSRGPPSAPRRPRPASRTASGGRPRRCCWSRFPRSTLIRPAACSQTTAITRSCSSCESVGLSPVVPTGLTNRFPPRHENRRACAGRLRRPRRRGTGSPGRRSAPRSASPFPAPFFGALFVQAPFVQA